MKKRHIFLIFICLIVVGRVHAATELATCNYQSDDGQTKAYLKIYDSGNVTCKAWISMVNGQSMNNSENCQGWTSEVSNTYVLSQKCPYFVVVKYAGGINGASVFVSNNQNDAESKIDSNSHLLNSIENSYANAISSKKDNCEEYDYKDCVGVTDKNNNTCVKNTETQSCVKKMKCSEMTTKDSCITGRVAYTYGPCKWDEDENKCVKNDIFLCEDYITKSQCKSKDEEGNSCVWKSGKCQRVTVDDSDDNEPVSPAKYNPEDDLSKEQLENAFALCKKKSYRTTLKIVGWFISIVRIIVPVLIIVFGLKDLYTAVTGSKEDGLKKAIRSLIVRFGAGVLIFLLPGIVQYVINMVSTWGDEGYQGNFSCCTDCALNFNCDSNSQCKE